MGDCLVFLFNILRSYIRVIALTRVLSHRGYASEHTFGNALQYLALVAALCRILIHKNVRLFLP